MSGTEPAKTIQSVETACEIIDLLHRTGGSTVTDLAEEVGMTPGAVHAHLATLREQGFIVQEETTYRLSPKIVLYGVGFRNRNELYRAAKREIDELAAETGEMAHLVVEHDGELVVLYERYGGDTTSRSYHTSSRAEMYLYVHATASGKAMLAHMSEERVVRILDEHDLREPTPDTITDREELLQELDRIRERGYALNDEEQLTGLRAVSAPVVLDDGTPVGAVCVSGPASRLRGDAFRQAVPEQTVETANLIQLNLQSGNSG